MALTRPARDGDLQELWRLYRDLNPEMPAEPDAAGRRVWADLLGRPGVTLFVRQDGATLWSTSTLILIPNLLRGERPHALIENVVTRADGRRSGHGRAVLSAALDEAWRQNARNVMLLTGSRDPATHRFYERCGFAADRKTGYVAIRPAA